MVGGKQAHPIYLKCIAGKRKDEVKKGSLRRRKKANPKKGRVGNAARGRNFHEGLEPRSLLFTWLVGKRNQGGRSKEVQASVKGLCVKKRIE